jgi:hypothetical protein
MQGCIFKGGVKKNPGEIGENRELGTPGFKSKINLNQKNYIHEGHHRIQKYT